MKHIITIVLTLFLAAFAMAQERNYISICGKTKTSIKWTEERKNGKIYLHTVQGGGSSQCSEAEALSQI